MATINWDPLRNVAALQDRINRLFDDAFTHSAESGDDVVSCDWSPSVDIRETGSGLMIQADLPGVDKEQINVEIKDSMLILSGTRLPDTDAADAAYLRRERCVGTFHRAFRLPSSVNPDGIQASFKNGVLVIRIPEPERVRPRKVEVDID